MKAIDLQEIAAKRNAELDEKAASVAARTCNEIETGARVAAERGEQSYEQDYVGGDRAEKFVRKILEGAGFCVSFAGECWCRRLRISW